jgi:hypothetical protein
MKAKRPVPQTRVGLAKNIMVLRQTYNFDDKAQYANHRTVVG